MTHFEEIKACKTPEALGHYLCAQFGACEDLELDENRNPLPFMVCPVANLCCVNSTNINGWKRWLNQEEESNGDFNESHR